MTLFQNETKMQPSIQNNDEFCWHMVKQFESIGIHWELILLKNGCILAKGKNQYGQLGLRHDKEEKNWVSFFPFKNETILKIACSEWYSLFHTDKGNVYFFGVAWSEQKTYIHEPKLLFTNCKNMFFNDKRYFIDYQNRLFIGSHDVDSKFSLVPLKNVLDVVFYNSDVYYVTKEGVYTSNLTQLIDPTPPLNAVLLHIWSKFALVFTKTFHLYPNYASPVPETKKMCPCPSPMIKKMISLNYRLYLLTCQGKVYVKHNYEMEWNQKWDKLFIEDILIKNKQVVAVPFVSSFRWPLSYVDVKLKFDS